VLVLGWVTDCDVRLREEGRVLTGEVFVVPQAIDGRLLDHFEEVAALAREVDWRIYDLVVAPVRAPARPP
jgi:hypothetical protein